MKQNEDIITSNGIEYTVRLIHSDYEGALNQVYGLVFHCFPKGSKTPRAISIAISDQAIYLWQTAGGNKNILEDKEVFAWQLAKAFLHKLENQEVIKLFIYEDENTTPPVGFDSIKAAPTISETARNVIFKTEKPSNNAIRREILKVCYDLWQNDPYSYVSKDKFLRFIPVSDVELERNLDYLTKTHFIDASLTTAGYLSAKITPSGIDVFEDPIEFDKRFKLKVEQHTVNIAGDMIVTSLIGDNNETTIKSLVKK